MQKEPIHVNDEAFEKAVLKSTVPVIVDFWAPWCGPCHMIAPSLEQLASEYAGKVLVAKVNTDEDAQYAMQYGVRGIPTLLFIKDGQEIDRVVGVTPLPILKSKLEAMLPVMEQ
jgi:thioredoxin 1